MANPFARLNNLLPKPLLLIGTVVAHLTDGRSSVEMLDGHIMIARGQSVAVGNQAFVRDGVIEGQAPGLAFYVIEV